MIVQMIRITRNKETHSGLKIDHSRKKTDLLKDIMSKQQPYNRVENKQSC